MRPFLDYVTIRTTDRRDHAAMADVRAAETEALREALRKTRLLLGLLGREDAERCERNGSAR